MGSSIRAGGLLSLGAGVLIALAVAPGCLCAKPKFDADEESNYVPKDTGQEETLQKARTVLELDTPRGFAVDEKFIYFFQETTLKKVPISASEGDEQIVVCSGVEPGPGPKMGGNYLYWAVSGETEVKIMAVSKEGGPATKAAVTKPLVRDLAGDSTSLFWITFPPGNDKGHDGTIYRLASPGEQPKTIATKLAYPNLLALDSSGGDVYFTTIEGAVVQRVPKKGGALAALDGAKEWSQEIAVTHKWVYWVKGKEIMRVAKGGGESKNVVTESESPLAMTSDDNTIYWAGKDGTVKRLADGTTEPELLAKDQNRIDQILVNGTGIFWETKSAIMTIPK
ncbi:MAG: hypothetical protein ABI175_17785 [Polyangiales bacterium]